MKKFVWEINETLRRVREGEKIPPLSEAFNAKMELISLIPSLAPLISQHSRECLFRPIKQYALMAETKDLRGIGRHYALPKGLSEESLEIYSGLLGLLHGNDRLSNTKTRALMEGRRAEIMDAVIALNPELEPLARYRGDMVRMGEFICGVTSGYNPDDIAFYLGAQGNMDEIRRDPAYKNARANIERETGHLKWVASPKTLEHIQRQLDERRRDSAPRGP